MCKYCENPIPNGQFPNWYSPDGMEYYYLEVYKYPTEEGCNNLYVLRVFSHYDGHIAAVYNINNCPKCGRKL